jgi:hypothetical protein
MMGILSSVSKFLTTNPVGKAVTKGLDTFTGVVTNPITAITKGTTASTAAFKAATPIQNAIKTVINTGTVAATVVGAGAVAKGGTATLVNAAKALIPGSTKGKVIAAIAAPVVIGAAINQPAKVAQAALNTPASLANFGGNAANLLANPSLANAKTLVTENPLISTLVGGAAVATIGGGVGLAANTVATYLNSKATKENTLGTDGGSIVATESQMLAPEMAASNTPITAQTETVSQGIPRKKSRKKKVSRSIPSINQKVNVIVSNKSSSVGIRSSKKYLNRQLLYN